MTSAVLHEEALCDAFVHNNERDLWRVASSVVQLSEGISELLDLLADDLLALCVAYTITVDDKVRRELSVVVLGEDFNSFL